MAVKMNPPTANCFPVTLKNLQGALPTASSAYLIVYDQDTCRKLCDSKIGLNKALKPCELFRFKLCCQGAQPTKYIAYVKVYYAGGYSEDWLWN
jgi:hypothetical protein